MASSWMHCRNALKQSRFFYRDAFGRLKSPLYACHQPYASRRNSASSSDRIAQSPHLSEASAAMCPPTHPTPAPRASAAVTGSVNGHYSRERAQLSLTRSVTWSCRDGGAVVPFPVEVHRQSISGSLLDRWTRNQKSTGYSDAVIEWIG